MLSKVYYGKATKHISIIRKKLVRYNFQQAPNYSIKV